jgi:hypothetical protein
MVTVELFTRSIPKIQILWSSVHIILKFLISSLNNCREMANFLIFV